MAYRNRVFIGIEYFQLNILRIPFRVLDTLLEFKCNYEKVKINLAKT